VLRIGACTTRALVDEEEKNPEYFRGDGRKSDFGVELARVALSTVPRGIAEESQATRIITNNPTAILKKTISKSRTESIVIVKIV
jgi:hypothetical protein